MPTLERMSCLRLLVNAARGGYGVKNASSILVGLVRCAPGLDKDKARWLGAQLAETPLADVHVVATIKIGVERECTSSLVRLR